MKHNVIQKINLDGFNRLKIELISLQKGGEITESRACNYILKTYMGVEISKGDIDLPYVWVNVPSTMGLVDKFIKR